MKRRVSRAPVPRLIPTLGQIAVALVIASASPHALAQDDAGAPPTTTLTIAGSSTVVFRAYLDGVEHPLDTPFAVTPGPHTILYELASGTKNEERLLIREGEHRTTAACRYDPNIPLGGAPPFPDEPSRVGGGGGCCGGAHSPYNASVDLRALGAVAVAIALTTRRRKKG